MSSIEDLAVDVANAAIEARIEDGKLLWDVSVETGPKKIESLTWKPHASIDDYLAPFRPFGDIMEDGWGNLTRAS